MLANESFCENNVFVLHVKCGLHCSVAINRFLVNYALFSRKSKGGKPPCPLTCTQGSDPEAIPVLRLPDAAASFAEVLSVQSLGPVTPINMLKIAAWADYVVAY